MDFETWLDAQIADAQRQFDVYPNVSEKLRYAIKARLETLQLVKLAYAARSK